MCVCQFSFSRSLCSKRDRSPSAPTADQRPVPPPPPPRALLSYIFIGSACSDHWVLFHCFLPPSRNTNTRHFKSNISLLTLNKENTIPPREIHTQQNFTHGFWLNLSDPGVRNTFLVLQYAPSLRPAHSFQPHRNDLIYIKSLITSFDWLTVKDYKPAGAQFPSGTSTAQPSSRFRAPRDGHSAPSTSILQLACSSGSIAAKTKPPGITVPFPGH